MTLPTYTWDQAAILGAWPPRAFDAVGINPATIRQWANRGHIHPIGQGPNGCKLYLYDHVIRHSQRHMETNPIVCHTVRTSG